SNSFCQNGPMTSHPSADASAVRSESTGVVRGVAWKAVAAYLAIAFGLAWSIEGVALARGMRLATPTIRSTALLASVMFTSAIAAWVVRLVTREGFQSAGLRFGPWRPYLAVWIGVPLLVAAIYGLAIAAGGRFDPTVSQLMAQIHDAARGRVIPKLPPPPVLAAAVFAQSLTLGVLITSLFTFGEEFGWTG